MVSPTINTPRQSVADLKELHENAVKAASPSTSPVRSKSVSPQPPPATLAPAPAPAPAPEPASAGPSPVGGSGTLSAVQEDVEDVAVIGSDAEVVEDGPLTESGLFGQAGDHQLASQEEVDPVAALKARMAEMTEHEKASVQSNLDRIEGYPTELPLSVGWSKHSTDPCACACLSC